jgi:hypothetical protein
VYIKLKDKKQQYIDYWYKLLQMQKEDFMLEVTESATKQLTEQLKEREFSAIRIFLNQGG